MSSHDRNIRRVSDIISVTNKRPTIVNDKSKFVVVTYWWGRDNYNNNTARPCVAFYESFIQRAVQLTVNTAMTIYDKKRSSSVYSDKFIKNNILPIVSKLNSYKDFLKKRSAAYLQSVFEYCSVNVNPFTNSDAQLRSAFITATKFLDKKKAEGKCPSHFDIKSLHELQMLFHRVVQEVLYQASSYIAELIKLNIDVAQLKIAFKRAVDSQNSSTIDKIKVIIETKNAKKQQINNQIMGELKKKKNASNGLQFFKEYEEKVNVFDILNDQLRFLSPLKFEEMIAQWEDECAKYNCNYLAVEYPEFAAPGGYQLAINAKPMFIQKALELCKERAVVYIDGDMYIRKYPMIFDIDDVDFMARGWWIDPRSSYKLEESIMYDPYTFETSGGIMYFSQSEQSRFLVNKWIEIAAKPSQAGKADDRVLSLVFNSYKMLLNMKIIQLPIEYLWLSLDYDERMKESVYDYNMKKMRNTIFVEHPECLTSEETASGAGASSDRTPKFYNFLGDYLVPVSETVHEYLMFPNREMTAAFKDYYTYMDGITYLDDGNKDLYAKGFVNPDAPDENESPLYIVSYDDKLGNTKSTENESLTYNQISDINFKRAANMNLNKIPILKKLGEDIIEIQPDSIKYKISRAELLSLILALLIKNKTVVYNPVTESGYDIKYYNKLMTNISGDGLYKDIELAFVPIITGSNLPDFFKPGIDISQPVMFRPGNRVLLLFISMCLSLDEFSDKLHYGSYEFMSRVRVGYLKKERQRGGGGGNDKKLDKMLNDHEVALTQFAQGDVIRKRYRQTRKNKRS